MFNTPILFLVFNRPDTTARIFEQIRKIQPAYLYVAADGPRKDKPGEKEKCEEVRQIVLSGIHWECEVKTYFRDENLGCGKAVSGAIDWFFQNVEEGIILEDDTLPDLSFFEYCRVLLERHKEDRKIFMISGNNFRLGQMPMNNSYSFSKYCHVWGWATWKRSWELYDYKISDWPRLKQKKIFESIFSNNNESKYWEDVLDDTYNGRLDTWDYQLYYACWKNDSLSIEPSVNLVSNIGFGNNATHTHAEPVTLKYGKQKRSALSIIDHPQQIEWDEAGDKLTYLNRYENSTISQNSFLQFLMKNLLSIKQQMFPNKSFKLRSRILKLNRLLNDTALYLKIKIVPPNLPKTEDNIARVHLGCGEIDWPYFINVDVRPYKHIHYLGNVEKLSFLKNNSIDLIYTSHCLEHISHIKVKEVLDEWYKKLKVGGVLRISVPDFDLIVKIYAENNNDMNSIILPLMGGQDYQYNYHFTMFNYASAEQLLLKVGFKSIKRWQHGQDQFSNMPDWSGKELKIGKKSYPISLNIEAIK